MEVSKTTSVSTSSPLDRATEHRAKARDDKQKAVTTQTASQADESRARRVEQFSEIREAIARITGANTRLSVSRSETSMNFVYRAIDIDTGEVVHEWPQDQFVDLVKGVSADVRTDVDAGLMLDHVA